jgi:hypothetical protein
LRDGTGRKILAGTCGWTGRLRRWNALIAIAASIASFVTIPLWPVSHQSSLLSFEAARLLPSVIAVILAVPFRHQPVFLAVTDRQLICVRMSGTWPTKVRFRIPRLAARVQGGPRTVRSRSITYFGPGARDWGLRFTAAGPWRQDLDDLVAVLQAGGTPVNGYVPGALQFTGIPPQS